MRHKRFFDVAMRLSLFIDKSLSSKQHNIPGQDKVLTGGAETCAKSTSPCLLAIPAFDRIAGLTDT